MYSRDIGEKRLGIFVDFGPKMGIGKNFLIFFIFYGFYR